MAIHSQYVTGRKFVELTHTIIYKDLKLQGPYNLCSSLPFEEITLALASVYAVSVLIVELVASPAAPGVSLCVLVSSVLNPTPTSVYSLATAVT